MIRKIEERMSGNSPLYYFHNFFFINLKMFLKIKFIQSEKNKNKPISTLPSLYETTSKNTSKIRKTYISKKKPKLFPFAKISSPCSL